MAFAVAAGLLAVGAVATPASAAEDATLTGAVTDPSGRPVEQAMVIVTNTVTGASTSDHTDASGACAHRKHQRPPDRRGRCFRADDRQNSMEGEIAVPDADGRYSFGGQQVTLLHHCDKGQHPSLRHKETEPDQPVTPTRSAVTGGWLR
jgi:hypothetical protein